MEEKVVPGDPMLINPPASRPGNGTAIWALFLIGFVGSIYNWNAIKAFFN